LSLGRSTLVPPVATLTRSEHGERRQGRQSALHRAATFGHAAVALALVEAVRAKQAAARTVAVGAAATTPLATTATAYVDHKDMAGWTPLHLAAQQGHSHAIRTLLEAGANHAAVNQVSPLSHP
jgi:ankyrin repeat protein